MMNIHTTPRARSAALWANTVATAAEDGPAKAARARDAQTEALSIWADVERLLSTGETHDGQTVNAHRACELAAEALEYAANVAKEWGDDSPERLALADVAVEAAARRLSESHSAADREALYAAVAARHSLENR